MAEKGQCAIRFDARFLVANPENGISTSQKLLTQKIEHFLR